MRKPQRRNFVENLENRVLLAAVNAAAGTIFTNEDGVRTIKMNWKGQEQEAIPGYWMVQLNGYHGYYPDQATAASPLMKLAGSAFRLDRNLGTNGLFRVYAPTSITVDETLRRFAKIPGFKFAEPDFLGHTTAIPNDPNFGQEWGMNNTGQNILGINGVVDADIDAPVAWNTTQGSSSILVGMIDTGIDMTHPDLAGNVWTNPGEIAGDGLDNDFNGYVDDIHGYDWWGNGVNPGVPDNDPSDQNDHGSHTAGTVGAVGDNGVGVVGVNWDVSLVALKIAGPGNSVSVTAAVSAMNYVLDLKTNHGFNIRVTNNSWGGGGFSSAFSNAVTAHQSAGILCVCAAGNNGSNNDASPFYPASYGQDNVISVGNMNNQNGRDPSSNFGATSVDLFAPGTNVLSTVRVADGSYAYFTGTSMASPHVAGSVALMLSVAPNATYQQLRDSILQHTEAVAAFNGLCVTGGRLSLDDAIIAIQAFASPATPSQPDMAPGSDSGISNNDNVTNVTTPTFTGTGDAGSYVRIFSDGIEVGNGIATGGNYSITTSALANGVRSITATASNGVGGSQSTPSTALSVTIDTVAPTLSGPVSFVFATLPHKLVYTFSENVGATLDNGDVTVTKLPSTNIGHTFSYNFGTNEGTYNFAGVLADGDYSAQLNGGVNVTDVAGNPLANNTFPFFFMMADANHDRNVNVNDFTILATNFGTTGKNFTQGDFNYDGTVNVNDFSILASRFGTSLAGTAGARSGLGGGTKQSPFGTTQIGNPPTQQDLNDLLDSLNGGAPVSV